MASLPEAAERKVWSAFLRILSSAFLKRLRIFPWWAKDCIYWTDAAFSAAFRRFVRGPTIGEDAAAFLPIFEPLADAPDDVSASLKAPHALGAERVW